MGEENVVEGGGGRDHTFESNTVPFQSAGRLNKGIERRRILGKRRVVYGMQHDIEDRGTFRHWEDGSGDEVISAFGRRYWKHRVESILRHAKKNMRVDVKVHGVRRQQDKI